MRANASLCGVPRLLPTNKLPSPGTPRPNPTFTHLLGDPVQKQISPCCGVKGHKGLRTLPITQARPMGGNPAPYVRRTKLQQKRTCLRIPAQSPFFEELGQNTGFQRPISGVVKPTGLLSISPAVRFLDTTDPQDIYVASKLLLSGFLQIMQAKTIYFKYGMHPVMRDMLNGAYTRPALIALDLAEVSQRTMMMNQPEAIAEWSPRPSIKLWKPAQRASRTCPKYHIFLAAFLSVSMSCLLIRTHLGW